ncbi:anti-sigma factor family protein, partial [Cellulomonas septica]
MTGRDSADRPDLPADDPFREWDAAYVLGALGPSDRRRFEEHLAVCDACQDRVAELAGMPGLLRALPPDQAAALLEPEPSDVAEAEVVDLAAVAVPAGEADGGPFGVTVIARAFDDQLALDLAARLLAPT